MKKATYIVKTSIGYLNIDESGVMTLSREFASPFDEENANNGVKALKARGIRAEKIECIA